MKSDEIRRKYIDYFLNKGHKLIQPASLILQDDSSTLFTSAGMQPLVTYFLGNPHSQGKRLVNIQPSIRLGDIEEVGDNRHTTFFEMLGNWSLGDYFKSDQIVWIYEFFTKELGLSKEKLWVSVFEGDKQVPRDDESFNVWQKLGVAKEHINFYSAKKNWWSMTGTPKEMKVGDIGGPDSEIFYDFGQDLHLHEKSKYKNEKCHPNCDCGRFLEIGNSVFIQYKKVSDDLLKPLPQKNVDFGGGLERITAVVQNKIDIFTTDLFEDVVESIENKYKVNFAVDAKIDRSIRIIADHLRASSALISSGIIPSNKMHGYVLRRLIRRSVLHARILSGGNDLSLPEYSTINNTISLDFKSSLEINLIIKEEAEKFGKALEKGMKRLIVKTNKQEKITGDFAFDLYQTEGFPLEVTLEVLENNGIIFPPKELKHFQSEFEKHKQKSRTQSAGIFKGGLADTSEQVVKLHTATHLLLASLRQILGEQVVQKGQNITSDRSRFDFPNNEKLKDEELKEVEDLINGVIIKNLPVKFELMTKGDALKTGAIHEFNEKYADTVKVYYTGQNLKSAFSKEFCGGPHVDSTGKIGRVKIKKQEKIGNGVLRIYLVLEN